MPIFYPPPPPQPPTPHLVQGAPAAPSDNPPFARRTVVAVLAAVAVAWQPGPLPIQAAGKLPVSVTAVPADQLPFDARAAATRAAILSTWQPTPLSPQARSPQQAPKLVPITAAAADAPPPTNAAGLLAAIRGAWEAPPPRPQVGAHLPSSLAAVAVSNPPFAVRAWRSTILAAWEPPPPAWVARPPNLRKIPQGGTWVFVEPAASSYHASYDLDELPTQYFGDLIGEPVITRRIHDATFGPVEVEDVTIELNNTSGKFTAAYLAGRIKGSRPTTIQRYDRQSGALATVWTGTITRPRLGRHRLVLEGSNLNTAIFDQPVPEPVVDTATWPNAVDVGATIPVVFGNVPRLPLLYVNDNVAGSQFDRTVGWGALTVTAVSRGGPNDTLYLLAFSDFEKVGGGAATSWAEVARYDITPGTTIVRTLQRQVDFNNAHHKLFADVVGPQDTRNPARAARCFFQDASWGMNRAINAESFNAAEQAVGLVESTKPYAAAMLALAPTVYYRHGEASGTQMTDASGNGRHGTYTGGPTLGARGLLMNDDDTAVSFEGDPAKFGSLAAATAAALNHATAGTLVYVYKPDLFDTRSGIAEKTIGGVVNTQWVLYHGDGGQIVWRVVVGSVGKDAMFQMTTADVGRPMHLIATYNAGTSKLYVNGRLVATTTYAGSIDTGSGDFLVGKLGTGAADYDCQGDLDEGAFIAGTAVTDAQALTLYQAAVTSGLMCDGALLEPRKASDWLGELFKFRGMRPGINAAGEVTLSVDQLVNMSWPTAFDQGEEAGERSLLDVEERAPVDVTEQIRKVVVKYRIDYASSDRRPLFRAVRVISTDAEASVDRATYPLVREHLTADIMAHYRAEKILASQERVTGVVLGQAYQQLREGDRLPIIEPLLGMAGELWEVREVSVELPRVTAQLHRWSWTPYLYTPAALPTDNVLGTASDFSKTPPTAVSVFTRSGSGSTTVANDGRVSASETFNVTTPTSNFKCVHIRYKLSGTTAWIEGAQSETAGAHTVRLEGLLPGTSYDFRAIVENTFGLFSSPVDLTAVTTATDATVPSAPSAPTVTNPKPGLFLVVDSTVRPLDYAETIVYANTANSSSSPTPTEVARGRARYFVISNQAYASQRWFFLKQADLSGNVSGFSSSGTSGASGAAKATGGSSGDIATTTVDTVNVVANAISNYDDAADDTYSSAELNEQVVITVSVPTDGGIVAVQAKATLVADAGFPAIFRLRKTNVSGAILDTVTLRAASNSVPVSGSLLGFDASPSGTQDYVLTVEPTVTCTVNDARMLGVNLKK